MKKNKTPRTGTPVGAAWPHETEPLQRILVVEDDVDIRQFNCEVLMESGYHVDAAEDGVAAWQALNAHRYDLLITDNNMPLVTGLELIKKLRAEDMTLPVILMSGTMPTEELEKHPWLQIQATLLKPYTLVQLFRMVREVLGASSDAREENALSSNWHGQPSAAGLRPG